MHSDTVPVSPTLEPVTKTELQLTRELLESKIDGVDRKIDGVEKWVKWGAFGIATNVVAVIGMTINNPAGGVARSALSALGLL